MLATLAAALPAHAADYAFEYKWDGVRAIAYFDGATLRLESRNLLDITPRYPELLTLTKALHHRSAILDGEIVALDDHGLPSFERLSHRIHLADASAVQRLAQTTPIWYILFDVLYLDGRWIGNQPYTARRKILESLKLRSDHWQPTPACAGEGEAMLEAARQHGMEGVVAKRLDSRYEPGRRAPTWLKIKIIQRQEFVIGGWVPERGEDDGRIGAMLLGYHDSDGKLRYAGAVGTGLSAADHAPLLKRFAPIVRSQSPFADPIPRLGRPAHYLEPRLVAEVEYRRWPPGSRVQQAAFKGLRADKDASKVIKEVPQPPPE